MHIVSLRQIGRLLEHYMSINHDAGYGDALQPDTLVYQAVLFDTHVLHGGQLYHQKIGFFLLETDTSTPTWMRSMAVSTGELLQATFLRLMASCA